MASNETWYYEYKLKFVDEISDTQDILNAAGIICVEDGAYSTAVNALLNHYGEDNIICINYLAPVFAGPVAEYDSQLNCLVECSNFGQSQNEFKYLFKGAEVCE